MMNIYKADGSILLRDIPVTSSAVHIQELMKSDYVKVAWSDVEYVPLPVGAYIIPFPELDAEGQVVGGTRYSILSEYKPVSRDEVEYRYEPEFQHPMMQLGYVPCLFKTKSANDSTKDIYETDWTYVGNISGIVQRIIDITKEQAGVELECVFRGDIPASASCSFGGVDILSAFSEVARAFDVEYTIDWESKMVYFGKNLSLGETVTLEEGVNVGVASVSKNNTEVANCFIVRGGTRNITVRTASGNNVETDTRLSLEGYKSYDEKSMIDTREDGSNTPKLTKVLIFDDIYPKLDLYVYDVRTRIRRLLDDKGDPVVVSVDAEGNPIYRKYAIYYVRLAYKTADGKWHDYKINDVTKEVVSGKDVMLSFEPNEDGQHSALAGREFKVQYHSKGSTIPASTSIEDSGITIKEGDYEINFTKEGDLIIPDLNTLAPWGEATPSEICDKAILYNIVMSNDYIKAAQSELEAEALKEIERLRSDLNSYSLSSNKVTYAETLSVAQKVLFRAINGYELTTRVQKVETSLEVPSDVKITIGNAEVKGSIQSLKEEVASANNEVSAMQAMNEAANAMTQAIANTQNSLKEAMAKWQGMWQFDDNGNLFTKYNVYSLLCMSAYGFGTGGGGGTGDTVTWEQIYTDTDAANSVHLANIIINGGMPIQVWAPKGGGGAVNFADLVDVPESPVNGKPWGYLNGKWQQIDVMTEITHDGVIGVLTDAEKNALTSGVTSDMVSALSKFKQSTMDLWGNSIDLASSSEISIYDKITFKYGSVGNSVTIGHLESNNSEHNGILKVSGNLITNDTNGTFIQIGGIRLVFDADSDAIKVIKADGNAANLYTTGGVSAYMYGVSPEPQGAVRFTDLRDVPSVSAANAGKAWGVTSAGTWGLIDSGKEYSAGTGLTLSGTTFSIATEWQTKINNGVTAYNCMDDYKTAAKNIAVSGTQIYLKDFKNTEIGGSKITVPYATDSSYLVKTEIQSCKSASVLFYQGQLVATEGVSANFSDYCYPKGGTSISSSTSVANEMGLRLCWSGAYFRDIFTSPNNGDIWHRSVENNAAKPWRLLIDTGNIDKYAETNLWRNFGQTYTTVDKKDENGNIVYVNGVAQKEYPLYWKCIGRVTPNTNASSFLRIEVIVCGDSNYPSQMRLLIEANTYRNSTTYWSISASITSGISVMPSNWSPQICLTEVGYLWLNAGILWGTNIKYRLIDSVGDAVMYSDCDSDTPSSGKPKAITQPLNSHVSSMNSGMRYQSADGSGRTKGWLDYYGYFNVGGEVDYTYGMTMVGNFKTVNRPGDNLNVYFTNNETRDTDIHIDSKGGGFRLLAAASGNRGIYDSGWVLGTNGTNTFMVKGNVGIGKTNPTQKLDVDGKFALKGSEVIDNDTNSLNIGWGTNSKTMNLYGTNVNIRTSSQNWVRFEGSPSDGKKKILIGQGDVSSGTAGTNYGTIEWDSTNKAFKFTGHIYATGGVSAYSNLGSGMGDIANLSISDSLLVGGLTSEDVSSAGGYKLNTTSAYVKNSIKIGTSGTAISQITKQSDTEMRVTLGGSVYKITMSKI